MSNSNELAKLNKVEKRYLLDETDKKTYYYEIRSGKTYLAVYNKETGVNLSLVHHPELRTLRRYLDPQPEEMVC